MAELPLLKVSMCLHDCPFGATNVQQALVQTLQPRAQIKPQQPRQAHGEIGITLSINGNSFNGVDHLRPYGTFNRRTGLPPTQHNVLVI